MSKAEKVPLEGAVRLAGELKEILKPVTKKCKIVGSIRRQRPFVGDIDAVVIPNGKEGVIIKALERCDDVTVISSGDKIITGKFMRMEFQIYIANEDTFGSLMQFATGSKIFNIRTRIKGKKMGLKVTQYGVYSVKTGQKIEDSGKTEKLFFQAIDMEYVVPESREL